MTPNNEPSIQDFDWLISCTSEFDATVAFVRDVLGLTIGAQGTARVDKHFIRYACASLPTGRTVEIVEPSEAGRHLAGRQILCFRVSDVRQTRDALEERGAVFVGSMIYDGEGTGWFYLRAPDGNVFQIYGPAERPP